MVSGLHPAVQDITAFIQTNAASLSSSSTLLEDVLHAFVRTNEDPSCSPNFSCATEDNIDYMLHLLASRDAQAKVSLQLLLLQVCTIGMHGFLHPWPSLSMALSSRQYA